MINRIINIDDLKKEYEKILIPTSLEEAILSGLKMGQIKKQRYTVKKYVLNLCASFLIALTLITSAVNISPTFADVLSDIPVIGKLIETLIFVDGKARGGEVTDGTDISSINVAKNGLEEEIVINFSTLDKIQSISSAYKITHFESPTVMQFDIGGARMISAKDDFVKIKELSAVKDIYTLMTLDDSLIRFNIVFNYPVDFVVEEFIDPASIRLTISKKNNSNAKEIYSVRTVSYSLSESFGHLEEELMWVEDSRVSKNYRILKDEFDGFIFELGSFNSKESADEFLGEISELISMPLIIEKRNSNQIPINSEN